MSSALATVCCWASQVFMSSCITLTCGVDNNLARVATSGFFRKLGIPVVLIAVDYAAEQGNVLA